MSDILIRGIDMPKNCMTCSEKPYDPFPMHRKCYVDGHVFYYSDVHGRDKDCPLHELPEHGDLIDRSELKTNTIDDTFGSAARYVNIMQILNAPVVIPSNKEDAE